MVAMNIQHGCGCKWNSSITVIDLAPLIQNSHTTTHKQTGLLQNLALLIYIHWLMCTLSADSHSTVRNTITISPGDDWSSSHWKSAYLDKFIND